MMIQVYAFATPNSVKVPIALEELGLDYTLHRINVRKGEQKALAMALRSKASAPPTSPTAWPPPTDYSPQDPPRKD